MERVPDMESTQDLLRKHHLKFGVAYVSALLAPSEQERVVQGGFAFSVLHLF